MKNLFVKFIAATTIKRLLFFSILILCVQLSFSQSKKPVHFSEAKIYFENGIKYSNQIVVHFRHKIFDLPLGQNMTDYPEMENSYSSLRSFFNNIENEYGSFKLYKRVKNAVWGDTIRPHIITGKPVRIHDRSQLFTIYFNDYVPIDEIIEQLRLREEVRYAHPPMQVLSLVEPNDLIGGSTGNQWNLYKINAPLAWDITKGSPEEIVGMVEVGQLLTTGLPNRQLDEFTKLDGSSKFHSTKGDFIGGNSSGHANQVAGIIGAATDDGDGLASLGWDIIMAPYAFREFIDHQGEDANDTFEDAVNRVIRDKVYIINCSFIVKELEFGGGGCYVYKERDWDSMREGIEDAINVGITVIAGYGNSIFDLLEGNCDPEDYPDIHPYTPYPASYPGVIGISATDINDEFGYFSYSGEDYEYNHGAFVDFCAPGIDLLTVPGAGLRLVSSGTSLASPQVTALVGLMKSLNPDLTTANIENIFESTVIDLGDEGWDEYYGSGRIDAYGALLETVKRLAIDSKSTDPAATGINNGRRIVKDQNGQYHLVFTSGNNIFYRKSTNLGESWSPPVHLSTAGGQNKYPCIATHGDFIFVTYQQYNGEQNNVHNYSIIGKYKELSAQEWLPMLFINPSITFDLEIDPLPVIIAADNVDNNFNSYGNAPEVMIAFRKSDGIYHSNLFYSYAGGEGMSFIYQQVESDHKIPSTYSGYQNPSIAVNTVGEIMLVCNNTNSLYAYYTTGGIWAPIPSSMFSTIYVPSGLYGSITSDGQNNFHISWYGVHSGAETTSILHRKIKITGGITPITEFINLQYYSYKPSTFGHMDQNGGVTIYWYTNDSEIKRVINDGTGWDYNSNDFIPSIKTNAAFVNSIAKDNPANFAYCWTSAGESPYTYSTQIYNPNPLNGYGNDPLVGSDSIITFRSAEYTNSELGVLLGLQIGNFELIDNEGVHHRFNLAKLDESFTFEKFKDVLFTLNSDVIPNSSNLNSISFQYRINSKNLALIKAGNSDVKIRFSLVDVDDENTLYNSENLLLPEDSSFTTISDDFEIPLNGLNQAYNIVVKLKLNGIKENYLNNTEGINLVNTYMYGNVSLKKGFGKHNPSLLSQLDFRLEQNYPNPFNPATKIKYVLPKASVVSLKIYDVLGREVKTLIEEFEIAGSYEVEFDGKDLPSGVYFYQLQAPNYVQTRKMVLLK